MLCVEATVFVDKLDTTSNVKPEPVIASFVFKQLFPKIAITRVTHLKLSILSKTEVRQLSNLFCTEDFAYFRRFLF